MRMRRREFIAGLGSSAAWPLAARAQQPAMPVVGVLTAPPLLSRWQQGLLQGLGDSGFVEGRNVTLKIHPADGRYELLPAMAADLVRRQVNVIYAIGAPAAVAAKAATSTIPIVFFQGEDPVELGLVRSLALPEGNMTGVVGFNSLLPKRLELLHQMVPRARAVAVLVNPTNPNAETSARDVQQAATSLGLQIRTLSATTASDLETVFASLRGQQIDALLIAPDGFFTNEAARLAALAARYGVPASHEQRDFPAAGGLTSYAGSGETARLAGVYVGRVLRGEKPANLPVMQPTRFNLTVNLKAAKALGLTIPESFLLLADEVIE
jgi:putative ABC transport system substrate-binding protein